MSFLLQLQMKINKDKKVRNSKWHVIPLSKEQLMYAAVDAYVRHFYLLHVYQLSFFDRFIAGIAEVVFPPERTRSNTNRQGTG